MGKLEGGWVGLALLGVVWCLGRVAMAWGDLRSRPRREADPRPGFLARALLVNSLLRLGAKSAWVVVGVLLGAHGDIAPDILLWGCTALVLLDTDSVLDWWARRRLRQWGTDGPGSRP